MKNKRHCPLLMLFGLLLLTVAVGSPVMSQETQTTAQPTTWAAIVLKMHKILSAKADMDMKGVAPAKPEAPGSPKYFSLTKGEATANAKQGLANDGKALQRADMDVPGDIIRVDYGCTAPYDRCGHTYPCDASCGLNQSNVNGHHYTWYMKTDDGNRDVLYTFAVHYSVP